MPVAKSSGGDFTPLPAGSHVARCFGCISLGTQESPMYPASFKLMLLWEVPGESITIDGKPAPMTISKEYALSLSEKARLRADLQSWRGREFTQPELDGFEVSNVVGIACMLSVVHKTSAKKKIYAAIASVSGLPKGVACPPAWHKPVKFEIEDGKSEAFNALPQWIKTKIEASEEWLHPSAGQQSEPPPGPHDPDFEPEEATGDPLVPF